MALVLLLAIKVKANTYNSAPPNHNNLIAFQNRDVKGREEVEGEAGHTHSYYPLLLVSLLKFGSVGLLS